MRIHHCGCNYAPGMRAAFDAGDIAGLIAPRPLVVVSGAKDDIFPIGPARLEFGHAQAIYAAAGAAGRCRHVVGAEGHRFYAEDAWPCMQAMMTG